MTDVPQKISVSELVLFVDDLSASIKAYAETLGLSNVDRHVTYHNGPFGDDEVENYSLSSPAIVYSVGGGIAEKAGGEVLAPLTVSIFIITRDLRPSEAYGSDNSISRDLIALWLVGEFLRFALRRNDWKQTRQSTQVPQKVHFSNLYTESTRENNISLWSIVWSHPVLVAYQRDTAKLDTFKTLNIGIQNIPEGSGADSTTLETEA